MDREERKKELLNIYTPEEAKESIQKVNDIVDNVGFIAKRVIIGSIIIVLFVLLLLDLMIIRQTIIAKDYISTTATFVTQKESEDESVPTENIYTYEDNNGNRHNIIARFTKEKGLTDTLNIKYNPKNPDKFYDEDELYGKGEIIWFVVKIIIEVLLIKLFFNKKLLYKIRFSTRTKIKN